MARGERRAPRRRVGLALGAGGARGLAHVGVLRTLGAAGVRVDAVVGTSIGAVVGAMFAAGRLEEFERQMRGVEWSDVLRLFDPVWPRAGIMSGTRAVEWLTRLIGDWRIEDLAIPFGAVAVDLVSGEELLIREGRVIDAIRASVSIPGVFVPPRAGKRLLVDGALRNPVPVSALESFGVDVRIAVNLHQRPARELRSARDGSGTSSSSRRRLSSRLREKIESRLGRPLRRRGRATGPNLFEILLASMAVLEHELALHRLAREPADVVLAPDVRGIRAFDFQRAAQAIHAGELETQAKLPEIEKVLEPPPRRRRYWR